MSATEKKNYIALRCYYSNNIEHGISLNDSVKHGIHFHTSLGGRMHYNVHTIEFLFI